MKYLHVQPEKTIYKNVFTLPSAHWPLNADGHLTIERYWEFPKTTDNISLGDAVERFRHLLSAAVQKQLVADVPIGAFLSSGLDSSTVVAVASEHKSRLRTFSCGFEDAVSELPFVTRSRYGMAPIIESLPHEMWISRSCCFSCATFMMSRLRIHPTFRPI